MDPSQLDIPPGAKNFLNGGEPGTQISGPGLIPIAPNRLPPMTYQDFGPAPVPFIPNNMPQPYNFNTGGV